MMRQFYFVLSALFLLLPASHAFLSSSSPQRKRQRPVGTAISAVSAQETSSLPIVEFTDPETQCQVVLLGCFHGTESSSEDVKQVVTSDTDVVALELCTARFTDLQRDLTSADKDRPWISLYWEMVTKTIQKKGAPTGLAAAVLGGASGLQAALSGFQPGLEFKTALERATAIEGCDIVLADQTVDETLRKLGELPLISWSILRQPNGPFQEWGLHSRTLRCAVFGDPELPQTQVQLGSVLTRNPAAIRDLIRLTVPPTILYALFMSQMIMNADTTSSSSFLEMIPHWCASAVILSSGFCGLALPAVRIILTERDVILTEGIQASCRQAGKGGRVVAVLGLLHVNGVAQRMLTATATTERQETKEEEP